MFLVERIISLIVYSIALFGAYIMIGKVPRRQYKIILAGYLIMLAVLAFNYKPYVTADLYRLRQYIEYWTFLDFKEVVQYALQRGTAAWVLYSYIIARLGNINFLQTITCLWAFGNVFYIVAKEIDAHQLRGEYRRDLLFYVMAVGAFYLQTISGIRSMLGFSIVAFCFYRETIEKKKMIGHLCLWLFAALLHSAAMILVISRFLFLLIQSRGSKNRIKIGFILVVLTVFASKYLETFLTGSIEYGIAYLSNPNEYTYAWEVIIGLLETCQTVYLLNAFHRMGALSGHIQIRQAHGYRSVYLFALIWTVISVISLPFSYSIFRRYTIFCTIISTPLLAVLFQKLQRGERGALRLRAFFILSLLIYGLSVTRGDLCGYKFF